MSRKNSENKNNSQKRQNSENKRNNSQKRQNRQNNKNNKNNDSKSSSSRESMDRMKYEIANEFGVDLGPEASSRCNGKVGGEMTKRLVDMARSSNKKSK